MLLHLLLGMAFAVTSMQVPAVDANGNGVLVNFTVELIPGSGRVLVATSPLIGIDTQHSERIAVEVAKKYLNRSLDDKDVLFIFQANAESIDGGSAGAAMAIALICELLNKTPSKGVTITGAIDENGNILPVGGIIAKARAAAEKFRVFLIPKGQEVQYVYKKKVRYVKGILIEEVYPETLNLTEYAKEYWNLTVVPVSNIREALRWFLNMSIEPKEIRHRNFTLPVQLRELPRVRKLADYELERAEKLVKSKRARAYLEIAKQIPAGYEYTRANYAFLAIINEKREKIEDLDTITKPLLDFFRKYESSDPNWRGEAEARLIWAIYSDANYEAKVEWALIAAKMLEMEKIGEKKLSREAARKIAEEKVKEAKQIIENAKAGGIDTKDAEKSLEYALRGLESGLYYGAVMNALDAIAKVKAEMDVNMEFMKNTSTELKDEFAEAYRRHALWLYSTGDAKNAAYLAYRAILHENAFKNVPFTLRSFEFGIDLKLAAIILLVSFIIWDKFVRSRTKKAKLSLDEQLLLEEARARAVSYLEKLYVKKKISAETFRKLLDELMGKT